VTNIVIRIIEAILIIIWAAIGPLFWFPFLVRMIGLFIGAVVVSSGSNSNMNVAQLGLDRAIRFYPEGFKNIHSSLTSIVNQETSHNASWSPADDFWRPLAIHVVSVALFWGITVFSIVSLVMA
jgi:hypothetical protein